MQATWGVRIRKNADWVGDGAQAAASEPTLLAAFCLPFEAEAGIIIIIIRDNDHSTVRVHFSLTPDLTSHCLAPESDAHTSSHAVHLRPSHAQCLSVPLPSPHPPLILSTRHLRAGWLFIGPSQSISHAVEVCQGAVKEGSDPLPYAGVEGPSSM